ncbi:hypothetical protein F5051DRAFT_506586 [Lentinula edodes]|nr:hypothetical protein F5051DRAFT_506586 [Lentinula edodes]
MLVPAIDRAGAGEGLPGAGGEITSGSGSHRGARFEAASPYPLEHYPAYPATILLPPAMSAGHDMSIVGSRTSGSGRRSSRNMFIHRDREMVSINVDMLQGRVQEEVESQLEEQVPEEILPTYESLMSDLMTVGIQSRSSEHNGGRSRSGVGGSGELGVVENSTKPWKWTRRRRITTRGVGYSDAVIIELTLVDSGTTEGARILCASGMGFGVVTPYLLKYSPTTLTTNTNPDSDQNPNPLCILSESPHSPRLALDAVLPPPASTLDVSIDIRANGGSYNLATDTRDGRDETAAAGSRSTTSGLGRWNSGNALQDGRRIQFAMLLRGEGEREREQDEEQDEIPPGTYESFDT